MFRPSMGHPQALKPNVMRVEHLPIPSPPRKIVSSSCTTERRSHLGSSRFRKWNKTKKLFIRLLYSSISFYYFNFTVVAQIFTNTCILQFILYLYNILCAFGIPQCVFVKNLCDLGSWFLLEPEDDPVKVETCRPDYILFNVYEINCVIDWHICVFYILHNKSDE
jgi:hypothetical protein